MSDEGIPKSRVRRYETEAEADARLVAEAGRRSTGDVGSEPPPGVADLEIDTFREDFALEVLASTFSPALLSAVETRSSRRLATIASRAYLGSAAPTGRADALVVCDLPSIGETEAETLQDELRSGGGLVIALPAGARFEDGWNAVRTLRATGWLDVGLVEAVTSGRTRVVAPLFALTARRPRLVAEPERRPPPVAAAERRPAARTPRADVSVVIPLYNHERYVEAALESVFAQTTPPSEIVVIDDGSKDGSASIAARLCARYEGALFWSQRNRGAHNTINLAISRSSCPVVAILNSDDIWRPDRLARCLADIENAGSDLVATGVGFIDDKGASQENQWYRNALDHWRDLKNDSLALINANFIMTTSNIVMRRRVLESIGQFSNLRYAHDLEFFIRALHQGHRLSVLDQELLDYRYHPENTIKEDHAKVRIEWAFVVAWALRNSTDTLYQGMTRPAYIEALSGIAKAHSLETGVLMLLSEMFSNPKTEISLDRMMEDQALHDVVYRSLS